MPFFAKATRDAHILTLTGHAFEVFAGQIYQFPDVVQEDVTLAGCVPVDAPALTPEPELSPTPEPAPLVDVRAEQIYQAVLTVIAGADSRNLMPEGYPRVAVLKKMLGFDPTMDEIIAATERAQKE